MIKNKKSLILVSSVVVPLFVLFANSCGEEESQSPSELIKIENIKFENKEVVFNGEKHSIEISGDLPEDIDVEYTNNGQIDAGTYEVVAKFTGDETKYEVNTSCINFPYPLPESVIAPPTISSKSIAHTGSETTSSPGNCVPIFSARICCACTIALDTASPIRLSASSIANEIRSRTASSISFLIESKTAPDCSGSAARSGFRVKNPDITPPILVTIFCSCREAGLGAGC
jgi:hypothetical protein